MQELNNAQQRAVSGGCKPNCVHADRRPVSVIPASYNPTSPAMGGLGGWSMPTPAPAPGWPLLTEQ